MSSSITFNLDSLAHMMRITVTDTAAYIFVCRTEMRSLQVHSEQLRFRSYQLIPEQYVRIPMCFGRRGSNGNLVTGFAVLRLLLTRPALFIHALGTL
jgi:hypothetical protein